MIWYFPASWSMHSFSSLGLIPSASLQVPRGATLYVTSTSCSRSCDSSSISTSPHPHLSLESLALNTSIMEFVVNRAVIMFLLDKAPLISGIKHYVVLVSWMRPIQVHDCVYFDDNLVRSEFRRLLPMPCLTNPGASSIERDWHPICIPEGVSGVRW